MPSTGVPHDARISRVRHDYRRIRYDDVFMVVRETTTMIVSPDRQPFIVEQIRRCLARLTSLEDTTDVIRLTVDRHADLLATRVPEVPR